MPEAQLSGVEGIYDQHACYSERRQALLTWLEFLLACEAVSDPSDGQQPVSQGA